MSRISKTFALMLIVLFATQLFVSYLAVPVHATETWKMQVVDVNGARGGNGRICPIAIDSQGSPHITYLSPYTDSKVTYASSNGSTWSTQTVAPGNAFDLKIGPNDTPHIVYSGLSYATWTGTNWTIQLVDPSVPNGFAALALDSFGNPHIAYTDGKVVKYAVLTNSTWITQIVDTVDGMPWSLSLAVNQQNVPFIAYGYNNDGGVGYFSKPETLMLATETNSSQWNIEVIASNITSYGNMVLDSNGNPNIIYQNAYGNYNSSLVYSFRNGTSWDTRTVISNIRLVNVGFLALDSHDNPHISYVTLFNAERGDINSLEYASWQGSFWSIQTVDKKNYTAFGPCYLALDSKDNPNISFIGAPPPPSNIDYRAAYILYAKGVSEATDFLSLNFILIFIALAAILSLLVLFLLKKNRKTALVKKL